MVIIIGSVPKLMAYFVSITWSSLERWRFCRDRYFSENI